MNIIEKLIELAKEQIGIAENPPNSSNNKFNQAYYGGRVNDSSLDWCVVFIWWLFREMGISNLFYGGGKTASCTTLSGYHQTQEVSEDKIQAGDLVFFDWSGRKSRTQHIGLVYKKTGTTIYTIEGNTEDSGKGGKVAYKVRNLKEVSKVIRPLYETCKQQENAYESIIHTIDEVPDWGRDAVKWGIRQGLISVYDGNKFNLYTSNIQVITWMYRRENK